MTNDRRLFANCKVTDVQTVGSQNQIFESQELGITFSAPVGWLLQQPDGSIIGAPDVAAVGPKIGGINPVISLTIKNVDGKTLDDLITEKIEILGHT